MRSCDLGEGLPPPLSCQDGEDPRRPASQAQRTPAPAGSAGIGPTTSAGRLCHRAIDDTDFDEFCFDLLTELGFVNVDCGRERPRKRALQPAAETSSLSSTGSTLTATGASRPGWSTPRTAGAARRRAVAGLLTWGAWCRAERCPWRRPRRCPERRRGRAGRRRPAGE